MSLPRAVPWLAPTAAFVVAAAPALAQQQGPAQLELSRSTAEVGQAVEVVLSITDDSGSDSPSSPTLQLPQGFASQGPSVSTSHQISFVNGSFSRSKGYKFTWVVQGQQVGRHQIGPASITVGGKRVTAPATPLQLVEEGRLPRSRRPHRRGFPFGSMDPFDPFGSSPFSGFPPGGRHSIDEEDELAHLPSYPQELAREKADDPDAFLYAEASPRSVVVGEQVNLSVYAYGGRGRFRVGYASDPSRADFLSHNLDDDNYRPRLHRVPIGGQLFLATQVRNLALFPIRAGSLQIGPMTMGFLGSRYAAANPQKGLIRESKGLTIRVEEPPVRGRPPGYRMGDVGRFSLSAKVEPREIMAGSAVAVVVDLRGTGHLPLTLATPELPGVQWLEPTISSNIEVERGKVGGSRRFRYVVRLSEAGIVNLGSLELPYWDPSRKRYAIAKASLGRVSVRPNQTSAPERTEVPASDQNQQLEQLLVPRKELGSAKLASKPFNDRPGFWALLFGLPALVVLLKLVLWASHRAARLLRGQRSSKAQLAQVALKEAREALVADDPTRAAGALERSLFAAAEQSTGLNVRGLLRDELSQMLMERGLSEKLAERFKAALDTLDGLRFAAGEVDLHRVLGECQSLVSEIRQRAGGKEKRR